MVKHTPARPRPLQVILEGFQVHSSITSSQQASIHCDRATSIGQLLINKHTRARTHACARTHTHTHDTKLNVAQQTKERNTCLIPYPDPKIKPTQVSFSPPPATARSLHTQFLEFSRKAHIPCSHLASHSLPLSHIHTHI